MTNQELDWKANHKLNLLAKILLQEIFDKVFGVVVDFLESWSTNLAIGVEQRFTCLM